MAAADPKDSNNLTSAVLDHEYALAHPPTKDEERLREIQACWADLDRHETRVIKSWLRTPYLSVTDAYHRHGGTHRQALVFSKRRPVKKLVRLLKESAADDVMQVSDVLAFLSAVVRNDSNQLNLRKKNRGKEVPMSSRLVAARILLSYDTEQKPKQLDVVHHEADEANQLEKAKYMITLLSRSIQEREGDQAAVTAIKAALTELKKIAAPKEEVIDV